jgi:hypothetical protein
MSLSGDIYALLHTSAVDLLIQEKIFGTIAGKDHGSRYCVWRRNGGQSTPVMGASQSNKRQFVDVFIAAYGETFDDADALYEALQDAVNAGSTTLKGNCTPPIDDFGQDTKLFVVTFQARLFHRG